MNPYNPTPLPEGNDEHVPQEQKPWGKEPQQYQDDDENGTSSSANAGDSGDLIADGAGGATDWAGGALDAAGSVAGAIEGASGCADGCSSCSCSIAILLLSFATAGTAMALFR